MKYVTVKVEVEEKKLNDIMNRLDNAKNEIRECYEDLNELGIIKITSEEKRILLYREKLQKNMKTEFTRKELIHNSVKRVRVRLACAKEEPEKSDLRKTLRRNCVEDAFFLEDLGILNLKDAILFREIILREFRRLT